jgi:hypothetical protein
VLGIQHHVAELRVTSNRRATWVRALRVTLALATEMGNFMPDADHLNALPGPLRKYIHDLETRADPAGDVGGDCIAEGDAALWARVHELDSQVPPQQN